MATDRETLSIVHFLRLTDRDEIDQRQLVMHNESSIFYPSGAEHSTTWLQAWRSQGLIRPSDREKLGQSAIGIPLYQGPMDTFLDPANYLPV